MNTFEDQELLTLCRELIKTPSLSGQEDKVAAILEHYFLENGFDEVTRDDYGNLIGCIHGSKPGLKILFDGHMDTVPVGEKSDWQHDPYGAEVENGRLYGRGTSDMKCALGAMAVAAARFAKANNHDFAGDIYIAGIVHEECFEGVAARSVSAIVKPDIVVIGEASELKLKISQRGRAEIRLETFGVPAHSSNPDKGVNAVYGICRVIEAIRALPCPEHDFMGKGIQELTDIKSSPYPGASVVPEYCLATYDRRLLVGETKESVLAPLQAVIDELTKEMPELKAKVSYATGSEICYTGAPIEGERFFPGWLYERSEGFIRRIEEQMEAEGLSHEISRYDFCTNGSHYAGEAGIRTVGFGPSRENLAHTIDEYVELSELLGAEKGYEAIMRALTDGKEDT
ncbi:MAG: YgeY family selenium metabolism-linked hydrolase [Lachnospiraceae bacterium]|nr:YgeY family selenium metabolism-linked hydrolase [Lachnospiraceae bacterium]